jgi:hypothetical protein
MGIGGVVVGDIRIDDSAWNGHSHCVGNAADSGCADQGVFYLIRVNKFNLLFSFFLRPLHALTQ